MSFQPDVCLIIPVGERTFASTLLRDSLALCGSCRCPRIQFPCSALSCLAVVCAVLLNSAVVSSAAPRASLCTPLSPLLTPTCCPLSYHALQPSTFLLVCFIHLRWGCITPLLFSSLLLMSPSPRPLQFHNQLSRVGDLISCERR